jgi:hypothetical protein
MGNLEVGHYFSTPIYRIEVPGFIEEILPVFDEYVSKSHQCNDKHLAKMTANMAGDERILPFATYVIESSWNILASQGYRMNDKLTYFHSLWGQEYGKMGGMDEHVHNDGVQLVGFYFLECPKDCPKVVVFDPRIGKVQLSIAEADRSKLTEASQRVVFDPQPGVLYITNAWLAHAFTKNSSEEPFKFIHFNVSVEPKPKEEKKQAIVI